MRVTKIILSSTLIGAFALISAKPAFSADILKVDIEKELSKLSAKNLYDIDPKKDGKDLPILSRMKYYEIKKNWSECAGLGFKVVRAHRDLQGWRKQ